MAMAFRISPLPTVITTFAPGGETILMNLGNTPVVTGTLTAAPEPSAVNQAFTITATLQAPTTSVLTGNVIFTVDGVSVGSVALSGNVASVSIPATLTVGSHAISAYWPGDTTYPAVTLNGTHIVTGLISSVTLTSSNNPSVAGSSVTLVATVNAVGPVNSPPTGAIVFKDGASMLATLPLTAVTGSSASASFTTNVLAIGSHGITATYAGDAQFSGSTGTLTQLVNGIGNTVSAVASPNPAITGQSVLLKVTIAPASSGPAGPPSGTVTFSDGGLSLGQANLTSTATASLATVFSTAGAHTILVTYSGDSIYLSGVTSIVEQINTAPTALTLTSSFNPSTAGASITFHAVVTSTSTLPVTGSILFLDGPAVLATLPVDATGAATFSTGLLSVGSHTITASFASTPAFSAAVSTAVVEIVSRAATSTTLIALPSPAYQGQAVTLSASIVQTTGLVTAGSIQFFDGSALLGTASVVSGRAALTTTQLTVGQHLLSAVYSGDSNFLASTSAAVTETILPSDYTLSSAPASISLRTGHNTTFVITATGVGAFADEVKLSPGSLPSQARTSFQGNSSLQLTAGAQASTTIYLDTDDVVGYLSRNDRHVPHDGRPRPSLPGPGIVLGVTLFPLGLFSLIVGRRNGIRLNSRHSWYALLPTFALIAFLLSTGGCSGEYPASTAPGTYDIRITASGAQTGITHTLDVPLTVTE